MACRSAWPTQRTCATIGAAAAPCAATSSSHRKRTSTSKGAGWFFGKAEFSTLCGPQKPPSSAVREQLDKEHWLKGRGPEDAEETAAERAAAGAAGSEGRAG